MMTKNEAEAIVNSPELQSGFGKYFIHTDSFQEYQVIGITAQIASNPNEGYWVLITLKPTDIWRPDIAVEQLHDFKRLYKRMTYADKVKLKEREVAAALNDYNKAKREKEKITSISGPLEIEVHNVHIQKLYQFWQLLQNDHSNLLLHIRNFNISPTQEWG